MIKIDYKLNLLKEEEVFKPSPEIINKISISSSKIFELVGKNSSGKTFILNLLAGALYAETLPDEKVLPTLKGRLNRYNDQSYCDLSYGIELPLGNKQILKLTKKSGEDKLIQIDNSSPLGKSILEEIDLIYDVPLDPQKRLSLVLKDISYWNNSLQQKSFNYNKLLQGLINQNSDIRDEEKIKNLEDEIKKKKKKKEDSEQKKTKIEQDLKQLFLIKELQNLKELERSLTKDKAKLQEKEKEFKKTKKPVNKTTRDEELIKILNSEINQLEIQLKNDVTHIIEKISEIPELLTRIENNCNKHFEVLPSINLTNFLESNDFVKEQKNFTNSITAIIHEISQFIAIEEKDEKYATVEFLETIKNEISEYTQTAKSCADEVLEKLTSKKQDGLIEFINEQIKAIHIYDFDQLNDIKKSYEVRLSTCIANGYRKKRDLDDAKKVKNIPGTTSPYFDLKIEITNLKKNISTIDEKIILSRNECCKLTNQKKDRFNSVKKIEEYLIALGKQYPNGIPKNLFAEIATQSSLKKNTDKEIDELNKDISLKELKLSEEKKKKQGVYNENQLKKLRNFRRSMGMFSKNMTSFQDIVKRKENNSLLKEDEEYVKILGKVIAYSMENKLLTADGKFKKLLSYDIIEEEFHYFDEEKNKVLKKHKEDVSTGLASANYLIQKINNINKNKAVILLDEIGNMDEDSLSKVIHSIKNLDEQNKLVLALLTKPDKKQLYIKEY